MVLHVVSNNSLSKPFEEGINPAESKIMVLGFTHCHYSEVAQGFMGRVKKVLGYNQGQSSAQQDLATSISNDLISLDFADLDPEQYECKRFSRISKTSIVNVMLENYKRSLHNKPLIPILFCIDCEQNPYPLTSEMWISKEEKLNNKITHAELRRAYKLCHDPAVDADFREIAIRSLVFVKVFKEDKSFCTKYDFEKLPPPWEQDNFSTLWEARKSSQSIVRIPKTYSWRDYIPVNLNLIRSENQG